MSELIDSLEFDIFRLREELQDAERRLSEARDAEANLTKVHQPNVLLEALNTYEHPDAKQGVYVVKGRHGELYVTVRPVEAWQLWAETNGYSSWGQFADDYEDEIEWSDSMRRGFLDDGGSMEYIEVIGYYRDGVNHL